MLSGIEKRFDPKAKFIVPLIRFAMKQRYIRSAVMAALERPRDQQGNKCFGTFRDCYGNTFHLLENYRSQIWPGWQDLVSHYASLDIPSKPKAAQLISEAKTSVKSCLGLLGKLSIDIKQKKILEIGCYNGAKAFQLAQLGACAVTGSDMPRYYLSREPSQNADCLYKLREFFRNQMISDISGNLVEFVDDDICESRLAAESFDVVASWDVLEHLSNPKAAIENIWRVLKPGGITYHVYHPFFCQTGGHGFCTLDFPWGHACLNKEDFARYVKHWRPDEAELSQKYYSSSLNRMTFRELESYYHDVGFQVLALIPTWKPEHLRMVEPILMMQISNLYPSLTLNDLITQNCVLVLMKPGRA